MIDSEARMLKNEMVLLSGTMKSLKVKINENKEKIKMNKQLPYLVANVVEVYFSG